MTKRSTLGGGALVALALLFIGLTVLFNHTLRGWRLDLTQNRLYTTAAGTDRILASIKEPINLYFFYSEKTAQQLPQLKSYGTRVREFLEELSARSNGKLHLHVIDPQPFSEEEDRAAELGVRAAPLGGWAVLFRPGRHELHRRSCRDRVLRPEQGAVPRVRRRQAHLPARQPEETGAGVALITADGCLLRPAGRRHAPGVGGVQRGETAL